MPEFKYIDGEKYSLHGIAKLSSVAEKQKTLLKRGGYSVRIIRSDEGFKIYRRRL